MKLVRHVIFIILLMGSMFAYCNSIMIGILKFAPPYSSIDAHNHFYGFCIDLMNEICKRLNETCEYKGIAPENLMNTLDSGNIDITFSPSPIIIEPGHYVYSLPYMISDGQFVAINPNIKTIDDIKNKKIGIFQQSQLDKTLLPYTNKDNIKKYSKASELLSAISNNEVDALLLNVNIIKYFSNNQIINFHVIGKPISLGNGYGLVALPKNANLINRINKVLLQIQSDGTYESIYRRYFGS